MLHNTASRLRRKIKLETKHLALLLPIGVFLYLIFTQKPKLETHPSTGKEKYYLKFNKDEIFKNLLGTEGHFRNIKEKGVDTEGFLNCAVKHLADAEGHLDEAISHSLVAETAEKSEKFRQLRNKTRDFRHNLQAGKVSAERGIEEIREIRNEFEAFNPEYDISKCIACTIDVTVKKDGKVLGLGGLDGAA
ncbi:hypothetical protein ES702_01416 [subsurface metagenome]